MKGSAPSALLGGTQWAARGGEKTRRAGVAIIIVLGLISMLTLAAVSFSVSMRIERKGASNFRDSVQARHMLGSALAQAVDDINASMRLSVSNNLAPAGLIAVYPDWNVLSATNDQWGGAKAPVLSYAVLDSIPDGLIAEVKQATPRWTRIDVDGLVRGRYSYIAVNTSGLLDANRAGGETRGGGFAAGEIQLGALAEFPDPDDVKAFINDRDTHKRYETLAELGSLNGGWQGDLSSFEVYSLSPEDAQLSVTATNLCIKARADLSGDETQLKERKDEIKKAFSASGVSDPERAFRNLIDYVDKDSVPQSLSDGCVERVPMINEVIGTYELRSQAGRYAYRATFDVEWVYPFDIAASNDFEIACKLTVSALGGNSEARLVPASTFNIVGSIPRAELTSHAYGLVSTQVVMSTDVSSGDNHHVRFGVDARGEVKLAHGAVVDRVPEPYTARGVGALFDFALPAGTVALVTNEWSECLDPRFNWDPAGAGGFVQWSRSDQERGNGLAYVPASTPGTENTRIRFMMAHVNFTNFWNEYASIPDGDLSMYVADRPLKSVGELGYLCIKPLTTIRLYDKGLSVPTGGNEPAYHKVLDYFTVQPGSQPFALGKLNVNTTDLALLEAVFTAVPYKEYRPLSGRLSSTDAKTIAQAVYNDGAYYAMSALGRLPVWRNLNLGDSEIARESPLRNSVGLLTVRQNLFTIILAADSYSAGMGGRLETGSTLASARAIAQVWRDPFPVCDSKGVPVTYRDANNIKRYVHRTLTHYFRLLDE